MVPRPFFFRDPVQHLPLRRHLLPDNSQEGSRVIHAGQTQNDETSAGGPGVSSSGTIEQGTGSTAPSGDGTAAPGGNTAMPEGTQTPSGETAPGAGTGELTEEQGAQLEAEQQAAQQEAQQGSNPLTVPDMRTPGFKQRLFF